jgi:D-alanyl-D-alanine dipeptidase
VIPFVPAKAGTQRLGQRTGCPLARARTVISVATFLFITTAAQAQTRLPGDLVYLRDIDPSIRQDMHYAGADNFTGHALPGYNAAECVLKRPAALALKQVQQDLAARNLSLKVYDCYRPTRAVAAMARWARDPHARPDTSRFYPALDKAKLFALGYIAAYSAHSRGVAIDLTIVPRNAPPPPRFDPHARYGACTGPASARAPDDSLDMGTGFDCFDGRSWTRGAAITPAQRANRRILLDAMTRHGFANYKREWWHFSYRTADAGRAYDAPIEPR